MNKQALWTKDFIFTCLSSFFLFMTFYILLATLPIYVIDLLKGNKQQIGLVVTVFLIASVLSRPLTGKWLDMLGRKKILFVSVFLFLAGSVMYVGINSLFLLLALRFFHGIGFGMATTATGTIAADIVPANKRGEGLGYYGMFMSMAMVIGPFLGLTIMANFNFTILFMVCSVFSLISFLLTLFLKIPENNNTLKPKVKSSFHWNQFFEPAAIPISIVSLILGIAYSGILSFISVYAKELGFVSAASLFFVIYAAVVIISRPFTGRIFDKFGGNVIVYPGIVFFAVGMIVLSQAQSVTMFLVSGAIIGLGYGSIVPSFQAIAINVAPANRRGLATATYFCLFDTGIGFGSYALGMIATYTNYHVMYLFGAGVVSITLIAYYFLHHRKNIGVENNVQEKLSA